MTKNEKMIAVDVLNHMVQIFVPVVEDGEVVDEMNGPCFGPYTEDEAVDVARMIRGHLPSKYSHLGVVLMTKQEEDVPSYGVWGWLDSLA